MGGGLGWEGGGGVVVLVEALALLNGRPPTQEEEGRNYYIKTLTVTSPRCTSLAGN